MSSSSTEITFAPVTESAVHPCNRWARFAHAANNLCQTIALLVVAQRERYLMQREREPRRLAHRAAERMRIQTENRWLTEQIEEAIQENVAVPTAEPRDPAHDSKRRPARS